GLAKAVPIVPIIKARLTIQNGRQEVVVVMQMPCGSLGQNKNILMPKRKRIESNSVSVCGKNGQLKT
ncbi:MAG: hypothetical protein ACK410_15550, partial [Acinetobacter sp.]